MDTESKSLGEKEKTYKKKVYGIIVISVYNFLEKIFVSGRNSVFI